MFVAVCDQHFGTSTSSWRKIVTPFSFPISAVRFSHSTASKGDFIPSVKYRWKNRPVPTPLAVFSTAPSVPPRLGAPSRRGTLLFYTSASGRGAVSRFRVWAKANATRFERFVKAASEKKADRIAIAFLNDRLAAALNKSCKTPMLCRWLVGRTQPHSRCRASNAGAEQALRARFFRLEPRVG